MAEPISMGTVLAITAVAKGVSAIGSWLSQTAKKKDAKKDMIALKDDVASGKVGVSQQFSGEMSMADDKTKTALDELTTSATNKLESVKDSQADRKLTFATSGQDAARIEKAEGSLWDTFLSSADSIRDKRTDMAAGAYGRMGAGTKAIDDQYQNLLNDIKKLGV